MTVQVGSDQYEVSWMYPGNCTCNCIIKQVIKTPIKRGRKPANWQPETKFIKDFATYPSPDECLSRNILRKKSLELALLRTFGGREAKTTKKAFWNSYAGLTQVPRWSKM